jgi:hypothetical protein
MRERWSDIGQYPQIHEYPYDNKSGRYSDVAWNVHPDLLDQPMLYGL